MPRRLVDWMKREQWVIWLATVIVIIMVIAAIGYLSGRWESSLPQ